MFIIQYEKNYPPAVRTFCDMPACDPGIRTEGMKESVFMSTNINLRRSIITIFLMTLMIFGCSMLLGSRAYAVDTPAGVNTVSGYESIYVSWAPVKDAVKYQVKVNGLVAADNLTVTTCKVPFDPFPADMSGVAQSANIEIIAFDAAGNASTPATAANVQVIHPMYVVVEAKGNLKLYPSARAKKAVYTLAKGTQLIGYGGARQNGENKRILVRAAGQTYYVKSGDVKIRKMVYNSKVQYPTADVENFINDRGLVSNPKKHGKNLIWVNTFCQRVYLMTWDYAANKWVIHPKYPLGLKANTGKELTPYGVFRIVTKWDVKSTTGTRWWVIFNSVGIHQKLGDKLGKPASGGCVRIPTEDAKWFYYNIGKGTTVIVY